MKKAFLLTALCIFFLFTSCSWTGGKIDDAKVSTGNSQIYDEKEIKLAEECVLEKFKDFRGCSLTELWYPGDDLNKDDPNTIILYSNFTTDSSADSEGFNPNDTYSDWSWILEKDNDTNSWKIIDWGY